MKNKPAVQFGSTEPRGYATVNWQPLSLRCKNHSKWNPSHEKNGKANTIWPTEFIMRIPGHDDKVFGFDTISKMLGSDTPYFDEYYLDDDTGVMVWPLEGLDKHI